MKHLVREATARLADSRRMFGLTGDTVATAASPDRSPNEASPQIFQTANSDRRVTTGAAAAGIVETLLMVVESLLEP